MSLSGAPQNDFFKDWTPVTWIALFVLFAPILFPILLGIILYWLWCLGWEIFIWFVKNG